MQPVEVTARYRKDGEVQPLQFAWQGQSHPILSTGRRWMDRDALHILAMIAGNQVVELVYKRDESRWYLQEIKPARRFA